jgi:AAA15 family ATPase/GTPase
MLLNFTMKNYKSFREETVFSMEPNLENEPERISTSVLRDGDHTALATSVVYGANASGKTSLITAMATLKAIVKSNNLKEEISKLMPIELMPSSKLTKAEPVIFDISFLAPVNREGKMGDKVLINYHLALKLGTFFEPVEQRSVAEERLNVDGEEIFGRTANKVTINDNIQINKADMEKSYDWLFTQEGKGLNKEAIRDLSSGIVRIESVQLYLNQLGSISQVLFFAIKEWFSNQFQPRPFFEKYSVIDTLDQKLKKKIKADGDQLHEDKRFNEALQAFGVSNGLFFTTNNQGVIELISLILVSDNSDKGKVVPSDLYESLGTRQFTKIFPYIRAAFLKNLILIIDEFDVAIHPLAIMNIIKLFHDPEINKNHAQLIFNTHNPLFLNNDLFRRDEIKFTQRDPESGDSELYSLADFDIPPAQGYEEYVDEYLANAYGGINHEMNFFPIFREMMKGDDDERQEKK